MNERIIAYLWYALEVLMEFGLALLVIGFVLGVLIVAIKNHEIRRLFDPDYLPMPWEKAEKKAKKKAERKAERELKAWREGK